MYRMKNLAPAQLAYLKHLNPCIQSVHVNSDQMLAVTIKHHANELAPTLLIASDPPLAENTYTDYVYNDCFFALENPGHRIVHRNTIAQAIQAGLKKLSPR